MQDYRISEYCYLVIEAVKQIKRKIVDKKGGLVANGSQVDIIDEMSNAFVFDKLIYKKNYEDFDAVEILYNDYDISRFFEVLSLFIYGGVIKGKIYKIRNIEITKVEKKIYANEKDKKEGKGEIEQALKVVIKKRENQNNEDITMFFYKEDCKVAYSRYSQALSSSKRMEFVINNRDNRFVGYDS